MKKKSLYGQLLYGWAHCSKADTEWIWRWMSFMTVYIYNENTHGWNSGRYAATQRIKTFYYGRNTHGMKEWEETNIHTHGEQEWEERNINNRLCDLEQACEHSDDHARLWNSFDTEVTVSIWLYLGQRERHNTYEPANTDATLIGSIQGQYTETGTLHSWAVYGDSIRRPRQLLHSNESAVYKDCIWNQSTQGQHITFIDSIHWLYMGTKAHKILFQKGIGCIWGQYMGPACMTHFLRSKTPLTIHWKGK